MKKKKEIVAIIDALILLILYSVVNTIETVICSREINLIGSTSFGFAQNTIHDFENTVLES